MVSRNAENEDRAGRMLEPVVRVASTPIGALASTSPHPTCPFCNTIFSTSLDAEKAAFANCVQRSRTRARTMGLSVGKAGGLDYDESGPPASNGPRRL